MDQFQLKALQHKRHVIANNVVWDETTIEDLYERHLLTKNMVEEIALVKDTSNFNKMVRYLDLLEEKPKELGSDIFERFVKFLGDNQIVGAECSVGHQLLTELRAERGGLPVEVYIAAEISILVDVEFTGQGRTDAERKEIKTQIGTRLQVYKEVWTHDITVADNRLAKLLVENAEKEAQRRSIINRLRSFLKVQRYRIPDRLRNDVSWLQQPEAVTAMEEPDPDPEILTSPSSMVFAEAVHIMFELCSSSLDERRASIDDMRSGIHVLLTDISVGEVTGGSAEAVKVKFEESDVVKHYKRGLYRSRTLLVALDRRDKPLDTEWTQVSAELELANRSTEKLEDKLAKLEERSYIEAQLAAKKIDELERKLADRTKQGRRLRREWQKLGEFVDVAKVKLDTYRGRSKLLEHSRTIGYVDHEAKLAMTKKRRASRVQAVYLPSIDLRNLPKSVSNDELSARHQGKHPAE